MRKFVSISMVSFLIVAGTACSKKDDASGDIDATANAISEKMEEVSVGGADMTNAAIDQAADLVEESSAGITEAVDDAKGKLADIDVDAVQEDVVAEVSGYADGMSEEVMNATGEESERLEEEAKKKLNFGN